MIIALLGTGLMGAPMTRCLQAAGHDMHVWNRSIEKAEALADVATVHVTAEDAVKHAEVVISMLADGEITRLVLDKNNVINAAPDSAIIINMGSVEPACDIELASLAASLNKRYLDAPVSGGVKGAADATLTIFVGGEAEVMEAARPALEAMGRPNLIGPTGSGQTAKLANQLIVAITIGAVSEAFKLAEGAGCDLAVLQQALQGGFADSTILKQHGLRMVNRDFEPGGRSQSQLKDIRNAMDLAEQSQLDLPLSQTVEAGFKSLVDDYDGAELDHSAYYLWLEKQASAK
ncbi:NAD(P)-dependent oxidoreductase [Leucothrix pacifica]|uniref:2-hydroxy-3-oxopropionate reductase n=1 Tax=Leucothrix pacifica TaxID=1247513 RepID=A0A317CDV1_9GAMM|nr:NAD(P)-dependent oxidoreductase [Leucothrix pacifica]PWQ96865.1 2-hydroxy-3-oxopropionate reductase [Leucothrix pacifica]